MKIVKSTYNFVPAPKEDEVFYPDWADQVNQDIPFSDGESGEIEFTITAETPIFIRNGHSADQETDEFSHYVDKNGNKRYFIPATSLKGMIRNNLEILSFSQLNPDLVNNHRYGFRDLTPGTDYMKMYKSKDVEAGWLVIDSNGDWTIEVCSKLALIHHEEVDRALGLQKGKGFRDLFLEKDPNEKSAKYKYSLIPEGFSLNKVFKTKKNKNNKTIAYLSEEGEQGTIVFTGQSSKRMEEGRENPVGKVHEFVFFNNSKPIRIPVTKELRKDFLFLYGDGDKNNESIDWAYWKNEQRKENRKIPVFLTRKGMDLQHFGLAFMYKLPYRNSIHQLDPIKNYNNQKIDLANLIFGHTKNNNGSKGRVYFGNSFIIGESKTESEKIKGILAGPKASFYPYYLDQESMDQEYMDYNNPNSQLRGFKKYPVHSKQPYLRNNYLSNYSEKQKQNQKVFSQFKPLKPGVKFKGKVRFHNLKRIEIGALISALTNHNQENQRFNIGSAKPYGFGKIKLELSENSKEKYLSYLTDFELCMDAHLVPVIKKKWIETVQVKELISLNTPNNSLNYEYPELNMDRRINEFKEIKENKDYLASHSSSFNNLNIVSQIDKDSSIYKELLSELDDQEELNLDFERYQDLSKFLNQKQKELLRFSPKNKDKIIEVITNIYLNHNASKRKLKKDYDWENNITEWIGAEEAKKLRNELNNN